MTVDSAIAHFRQREASLFRSTCTIKVLSGRMFDENTGTYADIYTTRAAGVACLIRPRSTEELLAGETEMTLGRHLGKFPADQMLEIDDVVEVTASTYDAGLTGQSFVVKELLYDDWQISRRAVLELNQG